MKTSLRPPIATTIPPEVIDNIVKGADKSDLARFSRIYPTWTGPCQRELFSLMCVDPSQYHPVYSLELDKQVGDYIRVLLLVGCGPERHDSIGPVHPKFPPFLRVLKRVETLRIRRINWNLLSEDAFGALQHIVNGPSFKRLNVDSNDSGEGFPLAFLTFCSNLQELSFEYNDPTGYDEIPPVFDFPPFLSTTGRLDSLTNESPVQIRDLCLMGSRTMAKFLRLVKSRNGWHGAIRLDQLSKLHLVYVEKTLERGPHSDTKRVESVLEYCGGRIKELHLQFERDDEEAMGYHFASKAVQGLSGLRKLMMSYCCPMAEPFRLDVAKDWLFPFLHDLPSPGQLEELHIAWDVAHTSTVQYVEEHMTSRFDEFFEILEGLLRRRFTGLRRLRVQILVVWVDIEDGANINPPRHGLQGYERLVDEKLRSSFKGMDIQVVLT